MTIHRTADILFPDAAGLLALFPILLLSLSGVMLSIFLMLAIITQWLPTLILTPCSR